MAKTEKIEKTENNPSEKPKKYHTNREFVVITYMFLALFVCMMGYFVYFQFAESEEYINNPYNKRQDLFTKSVVRGKIYTADEQLLADTIVDSEGNETRRYPYGRIFAHVVGYSTHGTTGIEAQANGSLLRSNIFYGEKAISELQGEKSPGDSVITTLDYDLQLRAFDALGAYDGAVIVMEPATGKILAMVSKPDYDPNVISTDWEEMVEQDSGSSILLNRATQGLYPPGSTFKIFTTLAYMRENMDYDSYGYQCSGTYTVDNKVIHCYNNKRHGWQDLKTAFANSCNCAYASLGMELDLEKFATLCDTMLFNTTLPITYEASKSSFVLTEGDEASAVMETSIGQGKTLVTPLHMALVTCAIANDGVLMKPYVIDRIEDNNGNLVTQYEPEKYKSLMDEEEAAVLQEYMKYVVETGTAEKLDNDAYEAAGKTGSAEFSSSKASHSWFVGYAHQEGKEDIAIAVIVEDSGVGSEFAVPVAQEIFDSYYNDFEDDFVYE